MSGIPDYPLGETLDFKFTTRQFSDGAPTILVSGAVVVYEDDSTAEITAGETLTPNFDGKAGLNNLRIVATGGNGYQVGSSYAAVLSAGTVGGTSVIGEVVAQFTINRGSALRPSTVGRSLDIAATGEVALDFGSTIGTLDAAQFGADFLTAAKIADNAFLAVNFGADFLTSAKIADNAFLAVNFGTDFLTAAKIEANAIGVSQMATGSIGPNQFTQGAADKVFGVGAGSLVELPATTQPPATPRPDQALMLTYMMLRNKLDVDTGGNLKEVHNDSGAQVATKATTDDGTLYSEAKMIAGT